MFCGIFDEEGRQWKWKWEWKWVAAMSGECKNANFMHEKILKIKYKIFHLNVNDFLFHFGSWPLFASWKIHE